MGKQKITVHIHKDLYDKMRELYGQQKIKSMTEVINIALAKHLMQVK